MRTTLVILFCVLSLHSFAQCNQQVVASFSPGQACSGRPVSLSASTISGANYSWTGPSTSVSAQNFIIYNPGLTNSGNYIVTATVGSCVYRDTIALVIDQTPAKPIVSNKGVCIGDTLKLTQGNPLSITYHIWSANSFSQTSSMPIYIPNAQVTDTGIYNFAVISAAGCISDTTPVHADVSPKPAIPQVSGNTSYCAGDTVKLFSNSTTSGVSYSWTGITLGGQIGSNQQNLIIPSSVIANSGYYISQAIINGCASLMDTIHLYVKPVNPPIASLIANPDTNILQNTNVMFTGSYTNGGPTPTNYRWTVNKAIISSGQNNSIPAFASPSMQDGDQVCFWVKIDSTCASVDTAIKCVNMHVSPVNVGMPEHNDFAVYPNPNDGKFVITAKDNYTLNIMNALGQIVYSGNLHKGQNEIGLDGKLSNGIYMINLRSGTEVQTTQLIIQR